MTRLVTSSLAAVALAAGGLLGLAGTPAWGGTLWMKSCSYFGDSGGAWQPQGPSGYSLANRCPLGGSFQINVDGRIPLGASAQWHTVTPPSIGITGALTPQNQVLVLQNTSFEGFHASYFWSGGTQTVADGGNCCGGMEYGQGINRNDLHGSRYFGFQATCIDKRGCGLNGKSELVDVRGIELTGQDNVPPSVRALGYDNLWYESSRWVRGEWPIGFQATDDSGVCGMRAIVDGQSFQGPTTAHNQSSWTQCSSPQTMSQSIDTTSYPSGSLSLLLSAVDAATPANVSSPSETLHVDNQPVTLALSGPTDAPSTAGTQYVRAIASAGPSGVADIDCSVDGSPYASYQGASAQIPVAGIGPHTVSCFAQNNAFDSSLRRASSALEAWRLSIRQPTISGISLGSRLLDALRCHRTEVRVGVPARWVTVRRHGKPIHVHRRAHSRIERAVRCHPRVVIRKVRGPRGTRRERIALLPHTVQLSHERIRLGQTAGVGGWVGLPDGTALANVPVLVVSAIDNGHGRWRLAAVTRTSANGLWRIKLRSGPSRSIAAVYPGSSTTEPATSAHVSLTVQTRVLLTIHPRVTRWGGHTIAITGRVLGGNIPAGKLLRLRIGTAGIYSTVGIPAIGRDGRFHTTWTFASGRGVVRYWFSVSTLPEADYPYAQGSSRRFYVTVHG